MQQNIELNLLSEHAPLFREPDFLLREELRDVESYYAVLLAIAGGEQTQGRIAQRAGIPERSIHYYLKQLIELGYVRRQYPLTGRRPAARHVHFVLDDPLLRFWFRFVFPNQSYIQLAGPRASFQERVKPQLDSYFGLCFERLCREALPLLYAREGVGAAFEVGEFWSKHTQIDVVGLREDGRTDLGECKWGAVRSVKGVLSELEARVPHFPNPRGATIDRRLFLRRLPRATPSVVGGLRVHGLEDLYA